MAGVPLVITSEEQLECRMLERFFRYMNDGNKRRNRTNVTEDKSVEYILLHNPPTAAAPDDLIKIVFGFWWVEKLLPDYIKEIAELVRTSASRAFFLATWGGEESYHSWNLEAWLMSVNALTFDQIRDLYKEIAQTSWSPIRYEEEIKRKTRGTSWFRDPWYANAYVTQQEWMTMLAYRWLAKYARRCGHEALALICEQLAADEARHHAFFLDLGRYMKAFDSKRYDYMFQLAYSDFTMPGEYVLDRNAVSKYRDWSQVAAREAVVPATPGMQRLLKRDDPPQSVILTSTSTNLQELRTELWNEYVTGMQSMFTKKLQIEPPSNKEGRILLAKR